MIHDIGVIGAGPVGLFVPFIAGMKKLTCCLFDSLEYIGGQCSALYPEKPIYDIPGLSSILASGLISNLKEQMERFSPKIHLGESIISYKKEGDNFKLYSSLEKCYIVKTIVLATGGGKFGPNRPPLPGIMEYEEKSIFYSVKTREQFTGKKIAIAGGGDSAVDWAISLSEVASKIYFIHRREKFKASPESVSSLYEIAESGKLEFIIPFQVESIEGANGFLEKIIVSNDKEKRAIEADILLPFFGLATDSSLLDAFGVEKFMGGALVSPLTMQTSIPAIYAVGDIASYEKKRKLILCGFHEATQAVYDIKEKLHPNTIEKFEYSTSFFAK